MLPPGGLVPAAAGVERKENETEGVKALKKKS